MRRLLIGLLLLVAAGLLGGGLWLASLMLRGGADAAEFLAAFRRQWVGLLVGSAVFCVAAVILQLTRPPTERLDWTLTASLGAGACLYILVVGPLLPPKWLRALPVPLSGLVPLAVSVAAAYAVLWPLLRRKPAEPEVSAERPRDSR
jgi:hypothetical protein